MPLLEVKNISKYFGVLTALDSVNISVQENTFHGLIGPNGSGKSTLLKVIAGDHYPDKGDISFNGNEITKHSPELRAQNGLNLKFQITAIFPELSVYDNILLSLQSSESFWNLVLSKSRKSFHDRIMDTLERFKLVDRAGSLAGELSH